MIKRVWGVYRFILVVLVAVCLRLVVVALVVWSSSDPSSVQSLPVVVVTSETMVRVLRIRVVVCMV